MINPIEQELREHEAIQKRMVAVAKRMLESKRQLQQEIRDDIQKPDVQAAINELKKRNAERTEKGV
ncbi:hypothetical protein [Spirosoma endophyticum]|uniref:Uncharacterized protein n=1 Tax=Spirosoma endophyticum TaxID=662367 RepID=A0A1I1RDL6_9BACT|nr:hypothetical protein [Spirosoma endophyticum]SFD32217.1 hypothetical protein SAMN05216167_104347 [Spirosoma endophyticum]